MTYFKKFLKWAAISLGVLFFAGFILTQDKDDLRWGLLGAALGGGFFYLTQRLDRIEQSIRNRE